MYFNQECYETDMHASVRCVYDEGAVVGTHYIGSKGQSFLVDADGRRILFGTGRRGRYLLHNLECMDVDPESIDAVVISHGHADHYGGLAQLIETRDAPLEIFAPSEAWGVKKLFGSTGIFVGSEHEEKIIRHDIADWTEFGEHVLSTPPLGDVKECFLVICARNGPVVLSGCSHCGVNEVFETVKNRMNKAPKGYVGGVHISRKEKAKSSQIASVFSAEGCTDLHLNHCTGMEGINLLRGELGLSAVEDFFAGAEIIFPL